MKYIKTLYKIQTRHIYVAVFAKRVLNLCCLYARKLHKQNAIRLNQKQTAEFGKQSPHANEHEMRAGGYSLYVS